MLKNIILKGSALVIGFMATTVSATIIDFEAFGTGTLSNVEVIDGVEFSVANPTNTSGIRIFNDNGPRTAYLLSCDFSDGRPCDQDLNVDFGAAVNNLSFDFLSEDLPVGTASGSVTAYLGGGIVGSMNLISNGATIPNLMDLSALGFIDRLVISSAVDPAGLGYDNFSFNAVPVPAAVWLFGSGLLGLIGLARRK